MAIYRPGPIAGSISGDLGGASFSNAAGSKVVRKKRRSGAIQTTQQQQASADMLAAINRWKDLTQQQRLAWRTFASSTPLPNRLGQSRNISGYQFFLKINMQGQQDDPPVNLGYNANPQVQFAASVSGDISCTVSNYGTESIILGRIFAQCLNRNTPVKSVNRLRWILEQGFLPGFPTRTVRAFYEQYWPPPVEGQYIAFQFRPFQSGIYVGAWTTQIIQTTA